ncbi:hypothetical protein MUG78_03185 [Gordonia alkaliphila]|uniref:hypothetical protein n=1 Tax=Gordonia alkaliphila TaxID=1053547 RepID=UPI001FF51577|nr:hypothetical protein [Gordonia alkaliphila]MCK0438493.1 hypothetical protein [Gordonia alkaliphila]
MIGLVLIVLIIALVVMWIISAKTYVVIRTEGGAVLASGTSLSERAAAEEMYSLLANHAIVSRAQGVAHAPAEAMVAPIPQPPTSPQGNGSSPRAGQPNPGSGERPRPQPTMPGAPRR